MYPKTKKLKILNILNMLKQYKNGKERLNPWNPLNYLLITTAIVVIFIVGGYNLVKKEIKFKTLFKYE